MGLCIRTVLVDSRGAIGNLSTLSSRRKQLVSGSNDSAIKQWDDTLKGVVLKMVYGGAPKKYCNRA
jgi:hypothetical protein